MGLKHPRLRGVSFWFLLPSKPFIPCYDSRKCQQYDEGHSRKVNKQSQDERDLHCDSRELCSGTRLLALIVPGVKKFENRLSKFLCGLIRYLPAISSDQIFAGSCFK